jgi:hypothetical protein
MGNGGFTPMLQVGGVQEAITVPPPACAVVTPPLELTATVAGLDELHVKGKPVMIFPWVSVTVAVIAFEVPWIKFTVFVALPVTSRAIDCTAQVLKSSG